MKWLQSRAAISIFDRMLRSLILLFVLVISTEAYSQTPGTREWSYHFGYLSNNAVRPGFNFGIEYGLLESVKLKSRIRKGRGAINMVKIHQLVAAGNIGVLWHPETSTSFLNTYTIEYRKTTRRRMQYQLGIGGAYMRSFFPNAYEVDQDGEVYSRPLGSAGYFGPTNFIGYGRYRIFPRTFQWWHVRVAGTYLIGYNAYIIPYLTAELRLGFHKKPPGE